MHRRSFGPAFLLAVLLAACGPGASGTTTPEPTTSASATPVGSATAGCPAAPAVGELPDWAPPSTPPDLILVPVSSEQTCGPNRFVFSFLSPDNRPVAAPDRTASVGFYDLGRDPETPVATETGAFVWAIEGSRGVYVVNVTFDESGVWGAEFKTTAAGGQTQTIRFVFDVVAHGTTVAVGDRAPASKTPTLADVGNDVSRISTDLSPVAAFYQVSVDAAVAAKKPFVVVFATPKFCTSGQCGPTLDRVKPVAAQFPDVTFINVEPYELKFEEGQLQAVRSSSGDLVPVQATLDWRLVSEPWIFVVDGDGVISASFEGVVGEDELRTAVAAVR